MSIKTEKIVVFDSSGNPSELRYYEAEKLVARLGTILDGDNNFIGLRGLDVEAVSPSSWFNKLRHKPQPKRIDILTVDFIGLINWINTIKTIKTIENIDLVAAITSIANIASLDLIDRITLIDTITAITNIANIGMIHDIYSCPSVYARTVIKNADFEKGDLRSWFTYALGGSSIVIEAETTPATNRGNYYVKMTSTLSWAYLWQFFEPTKTIDARSSVLAKTDASAGTLAVIVRYTDGTTNLTNISPTTSWVEYPISFTADKVAISIQINNTKDNSVVYVDNVVIVPTEYVSQTTRTNLKAQTEREDTLFKRFANTFAAAGDFAVLAAVAGQKHKVFSYGYNSDADIETLVRDGTSATNQVGISTTKGKMLQTLMHPFVGSVNTVLNLRAEGTVTVKGWIQYKTEA